MATQEKFMEKHQKFLDGVKKYIDDNGVDCLIMIGDMKNMVMPWKIFNKNNSDVMVDVIKQVQLRPEGMMYSEHFVNESEMKDRIQEIEEDGSVVTIHDSGTCH